MCTGGWLSSYLAGGDELKGPEGGLHVGDVGLELVESSGDAGLDLIGLGPRGGVGRDLVKGLLRHDGRISSWSSSSRKRLQVSAKFGEVVAFRKPVLVCLPQKAGTPRQAHINPKHRGTSTLR